MGRRPKDDKSLLHVLFSPPKKRGRPPKRKQTSNEVGTIVAVAFACGALWLVRNYSTTIFLLAALGIAVVVLFKIQKNNSAKKCVEEARKCIELVVNQHLKTLTLRRSQMVYKGMALT